MDYSYNDSAAVIIGMTDTDEKVTAASGRISTLEGTALSIWDKSQDNEKNRSLIGKVTRSGHNSVVEHTYFNIAFQNVTAVVEQFIIEFRLASFTVKSRRYVDFSDAGFYVPELGDESLKAAYTAHMSKLFKLYGELLDKGVAREDARFVLPYCLYSNFFCSVNGREFLHMLRAMLYGRGSKFPEIKRLGEQLLKQAKKMAPGITDDFERLGEDSRDDIPDLSFINIRPSPSRDSVELLYAHENAARSVAQSALIADGNYSAEQIEKILSDDDTVDKIISSVMDCRRQRALESVSYTLRFNRVSLSGITHFARHRIQSIDIPQLTKTNRLSYIIPPFASENDELAKKYHEAFKINAAEYERMKKLGVPEEVLVYYQLSGNTLDIVTTMNARQLLLFMKLRTCNRAQWEIRAHATQALSLLRKAEPRLFSYYGPSCFKGACPEGRLSCGRASEIREKFSAL